MAEDVALRALLTGGDKLHRAPPRGLPFRVVNHYGPTENTVVATSAVVEPGERGTPPIGRPIGNVRAYVLDQWESGSGRDSGRAVSRRCRLAAGYWNLPELTASKFVRSPFNQDNGGRLYRTGDRVRHRRDGSLEFLGRLDAQVKLRGFRVEPGEVEACSRGMGSSATASSSREEVEGDARLIACVVCGNVPPPAQVP